MAEGEGFYKNIREGHQCPKQTMGSGYEASDKLIYDFLISLQTTFMDKEAEVNFLEKFHGPSLKAFIIGGGLVLFQQVSLPPRLTILFIYLLVIIYIPFWQT